MMSGHYILDSGPPRQHTCVAVIFPCHADDDHDDDDDGDDEEVSSSTNFVLEDI